MNFSCAWSASSLSLSFCLSQNLNFPRKACADLLPNIELVSPLLYRASFLLLQSTCYSGNCYTYLINVGLIH